MNRKLLKMFVLGLFVHLALASAIASAETITHVPESVACTLAGTGVGMCFIVFPADTITSCPSSKEVIFDPKGTLGTEVYAMALAAVAARQNLEIGTLPACHELGRAMIDGIRIKP